MHDPRILWNSWNSQVHYLLQFSLLNFYSSSKEQIPHHAGLIILAETPEWHSNAVLILLSLSSPSQHKVTEPAAKVNQIDRLNGLDDLRVLGVEQPETTWEIEDIKPKDDEVELSDVEDESNASKGFSK